MEMMGILLSSVVNHSESRRDFEERFEFSKRTLQMFPGFIDWLAKNANWVLRKILNHLQNGNARNLR